MDAVFSGSDHGVRSLIERHIDALGIRGHVKMVGFLPVAEVAALYKGAVALVMPTYFGPTNIPPLEAEALGCPLIYSDLPGYRDFAGPGALYCDLTRPDHLADLVTVAANRPRPTPIQRDWKEVVAREQFVVLVNRLAAKISAWSD
jgi:glycosyltransferase involved in cell wall biosynthesis